MTVLIYTLSIALQVAGALMLIVFAISTKRTSIIRSFASNNVIFEDGDTHKLEYNHEAFIAAYRTAYYSKVSVIFIALGYGVGIFGDSGDANCCYILVGVICLTALLILTARIIVEKMLKRGTVTAEITKKELENAGCDSTMRSASTAEIDALFVETREETGLDEVKSKLDEINDKYRKCREDRK